MRNKRKLLVALVAVLVLTTSIVSAEGGLGAYFSEIKLYLNGEKIDKKVVVIDGSSYLPVRAIGETLDLDVVWNGETQSIELSSNKEASSSASVDKEMLDIMTENNKQLKADIAVLEELLKRNNIKIPASNKDDVYIGEGEGELQPMDGGIFGYITPQIPTEDSIKNKYTKGILIYGRKANVGSQIYYDGTTFATQGQYDSFKATFVKHPDKHTWNDNGYFRVLADGVEVYKSEYLTNEVFAQEIEVDISGAKIVKLEFNGPKLILSKARFTK